MIPLDAAAVQRVSSGEPEWLSAARADAFSRFERLDLPSPKQEIWRYVDLGFSLDDFALPVEPGPVTGSSGRGLQIVDGISIGGPAVGGEGLTVTSLARAWRNNPELAGAFEGFGSVVHDKFSAAARAFGADGAYVRIHKGAYVARPVFVDVRAATASAVSFPRVVVVVEDGGEASVVIDLSSADDLEALVCPEIDVSLGANAVLRLTVVQGWGAQTTSLARARVVAGRDAVLDLAEAGLGGALSRLHLNVDLEGRGSSARIVGTYFGDSDQVLDYRYFMRHIGENTTSDMFLKGAVEDHALSIFTGMIRIEETAQRTNAFQTNRNLLLSEDAAAQSVPNLEILANDVKCGHGSTVGPLDAEQRYYLMSRGLERKRADRLQVRGFFEEALGRFPEESVAAPVRERINAKFVEAQREGRV